jgi:hypothetical protein
MRRKLTIIALAAMMLAAGEPAMAQSPNLQLQVKPQLRIQPRINKAPIRQPIIPPSMATKNIQVMIPGATVLKILPLSNGDFMATIRIENQVKKIRVDGETGAVQN